MTTLAEQVAEVKDGEYVRVGAKGRNGEFFLEGKLDSLGDPTYLELGHLLIRSYRGEVNSSLTSITRVPRPIPSEPEVGSFALLRYESLSASEHPESLFVSIREPSEIGSSEWYIRAYGFQTWQLIYPTIIRLYTPSGELVTGFEYATKEKGMENQMNRPEIVVLCGSTRFYDEFQEANYDLTMQGKIVLSVGFYPHSKVQAGGHGEGVGHDSTEKIALDELHKRKIDLADRVFVLNVGGYIGESTRSEIEYAEEIGRPIDYLVQKAGEA